MNITTIEWSISMPEEKGIMECWNNGIVIWNVGIENLSLFHNSNTPLF